MVYEPWHRSLIHISSSESTFFSVVWKSLIFQLVKLQLRYLVQFDMQQVTVKILKKRLKTLSRQPLLPVRRCHRLLPRGVRAGAASPPDPPRVRAARGPDLVRAAAAAAAAAAPFPPSSLNASLPPRPASYFLDPVSASAWQANRRLQGSRRAPSLARHKDGAAGDCRRRSREASPTAIGGRGPTGKVVN